MPTDPKGRTAPGYERHVFVCGHERPEGASRPSCSKRGSLDLMRLLKTSEGIIQESDRDSYENKRIDTCGVLLNNLFRNNFNKLVKDMQKHISFFLLLIASLNISGELPEMILGNEKIGPGINLVFEGAIKDDVFPSSVFI